MPLEENAPFTLYILIVASRGNFHSLEELPEILRVLFFPL